MNQPETKLPSMPGEPPKLVQAVKVKSLHFDPPRQLPMKYTRGGYSKLVAGTDAEESEVVVQIQHEPWNRHHRVREYDAGRLRVEFCVPEGWALYVPETA